MPKPRKSLEQLKLSGTYDKNPGRYSKCYEPPDNRPVGEPYRWLRPEAQEAWRELVPNLPWLRCCHRGIVGITAMLAGRLRKDTLGVSGMVLLTQCLNKLGATPEGAAKVGWAPPAEEEPGDEFFR